MSSAGGAGGARVVFREVSTGESRLWETKRIQHANLNRLHLRSIECILDPTVPADSIIGAVAYAVTSHGLRVTQRERGRIVAQRVEAPYLASASSGSWRSGSGQEREEWRMVVASLGVSKEGGGGGKVVERVLSVSFMTDPVFKPTDLAGKGAAAMASLFGSVGSAAANLGSSISSGSSGGSGGGGGGGSGVGKASGGAGGSASGGSLSAVEIANARSNQRAESLLQAIVAELGEVGWGGGGGGGALATASADQGTGVNSVVVPGGGAGARPPPVGSSPEQGASEEGEAANGAKDFACAVLREEVLVLAPFAGSSGGGGGGDTGVPAATAASSSSPFSPEEAGGKRGAAEERQDTSQQGGQEAEEAGDGVGKAGAGAGADGSGDSSAVVEVRLCLQFVEGLCARAEEYSRRDASETWKPLEKTISRLERDNTILRQLLEPKYRAAGAAPPAVPTWAGRRSLGARDGSWLGPAAATATGNGPSPRVVALVRSSPLFALEGKAVKARVVAKPQKPPADTGAGAGAGPDEPCGGDEPQVRGGGGDGGDSSLATGGTGTGGGGRRHVSLVQAAVKTLAEVIGRACEAQEEVFLKARLPGAQAYTVELERYRSAVVGGGALRAAAEGGRGRGRENGAGGGDGEVDDELWRLFAARETRLFSSSAALGKKPGRIYVTHDTLWFHSKVLGFESRHVVHLAEVQSITLLGTALDLSSSLVLGTTSGGVPGELMLVFPGQKLKQVEPLEILLRQLVKLATKEQAAAAAAAGAAGAGAAVVVVTPEGSHDGEDGAEHVQQFEV